MQRNLLLQLLKCEDLLQVYVLNDSKLKCLGFGRIARRNKQFEDATILSDQEKKGSLTDDCCSPNVLCGTDSKALVDKCVS